MKLIEIYYQFDQIRLRIKEGQCTYTDFKDLFRSLLKDLEDKYQVYCIEVVSEETESPGIIGFDLLGKEVWREIPVSEGWEYRFLVNLFCNPWTKQRMIMENIT